MSPWEHAHRWFYQTQPFPCEHGDPPTVLSEADPTLLFSTDHVIIRTWQEATSIFLSNCLRWGNLLQPQLCRTVPIWADPTVLWGQAVIPIEVEAAVPFRWSVLLGAYFRVTHEFIKSKRSHWKMMIHHFVKPKRSFWSRPRCYVTITWT